MNFNVLLTFPLTKSSTNRKRQYPCKYCTTLLWTHILSTLLFNLPVFLYIFGLFTFSHFFRKSVVFPIGKSELTAGSMTKQADKRTAVSQATAQLPINSVMIAGQKHPSYQMRSA